MKTAALYIRVSTHHQEELSPDAQKRLLMEYATNNNMLVSDEFIYIEGGVSGRKADRRPEFQRMIGASKQKNPPFQVILVWKFSRFARNQEESIVYKSLLNKNNIEVISVSEPVIDGPFGSLIERTIEWMDEYYSIRLADEVHRGMTENALRGKYQSAPPLGYEIDDKSLVIIPDQAKTIKLIFNEYVSGGKTPYQIAKHLNALGLKTKQGKSFERRSVEYILKNPMYKGYLRWNMTYGGSNIIKDENEWIIKQGEHEPIISEKIFERAQERFKREYVPHKSRPATEHRHWLSSVVKCAYCDRSMSAVTVNSPYKQFVCNGYSTGKCATRNGMTERKLVPKIIEAVETTIASGSVEYIVIKKEGKSDIDLLKSQLTRIESKEKRIKDAYINGIDSLEEYKHNKEVIEKEKQVIENKIHKSNDTSYDYNKEMIRRIKDVYEIITNDSIDNITKNKSIKSVVEKVVFSRKDMSVDIYFYYT